MTKLLNKMELFISQVEEPSTCYKSMQNSSNNTENIYNNGNTSPRFMQTESL